MVKINTVISTRQRFVAGRNLKTEISRLRLEMTLLKSNYAN